VQQSNWFIIPFLVALGAWSAYIARNRWTGKYGLSDYQSTNVKSDFSEPWLRLASSSLSNALALNGVALAYIASAIVQGVPKHSWTIWLVVPFLFAGSAAFIIFFVLGISTFVSNKPSRLVPHNLRDRQLGQISFGVWFMGPRPRQ
jgi:hypothetical protein